MLIADELKALDALIPDRYPADKASTVLGIHNGHSMYREAFTVWWQAHHPDATTVDDLPPNGRDILAMVRSELEKRLREADLQPVPVARPRRRRATVSA